MGTSRSRSLTALGALAFAAPFNVALRFAPPVFLLPLVALALGVGLVAVFTGVSTALDGREDPPDRRLRLLVALVGMTLAGVWLSVFAGDDLPLNAATGARVSVMPVVALATAAHVRTRSDVAFLLRCGVVGAAVGVVIGLVVLGAGRDVLGTTTFFGSITQLGPLDRLTRPWAHANVAAMALGAVGAGVASIRGRPTRRAVLGIMLVGLVATASRGGLLALAAAGATWVVLHRSDRAGAATNVGLIGVAVTVLALASPSATSRIGADEPLRWWGVAIDAPSELSIDESGSAVSIVVENESSSNWPIDGPEPVQLSARFSRPGSDEVTGEQRWLLPQAMQPGDRVTLDVIVEPLGPVGETEITWDLLIDQRAYFRQFSGVEPVLTQGVIAATSLAVDAEPVGAFVEPVGRAGRLEIWRLGLEQFSSDPLLGTGPGAYSSGLDDLDVSHGHSLLIEPLVAWGLVGTLPLMALFGGAALFGLRRAWVSGDSVDRAVACSVVAVVVHGLVDWHLVHVSAAIPVGVLVGLAWAPPRPRSVTDTAQN